MTIAALIFEGLVAALVLVAAVMLWRVDARLRALKSGTDGVRAAVVALDEATDRARASLASLERATLDGGAELEARVREARRLSDELQLLSGAADRRAEGMAERSRRRPVAEIFPSGGRPGVFGDLKDVR